ncbi:MAG: hypothetical protein ACKVRP_02320 [Bacteroidota bacterium]
MKNVIDAIGAVQGLAAMFPGGNAELKVYTTKDGYTLLHGPLTLEQDERFLALIKHHGGDGWESFLKSTLKDVIDTLFEEGFIYSALEIVLDWHDDSTWEMIKRWIRMGLTGKRKRDVVRRLDNNQIGEMIADFFPMNSSSMRQSRSLSSRTISSSTSPASALSPSGT